MTYRIELDLSHEMTEQEMIDFGKKYNLSFKMIEEEGPAGGNPLVEYSTDDQFNIIKFLAEAYTDGSQAEIEYFTGLILEDGEYINRF